MNKTPTKSYIVKQPAELLPFLIEHMHHLSRNAVKAILARGEVAVDGARTTAFNAALQAGQTVSILPKGQLAAKAALVGLTILHEDDDLIVVLKEAGLLSIAAPNETEMTAYRQLSAHVRRANPNNRIFIVHRLDRDTSGVMMFAKNEKVQQQLQNSWHDSVRERIYIALVEGKVRQPEGTIRSWLKESKAFKMHSSKNPTDGQLAITHYKVLQDSGDYSLLEVSLETGRKNQIRVHMQDIGHPVVGDKKYGSKSNAIGRLGLHAKILTFIHPISGEVMRFESTLPKAFMRPFKS